MSTSDDTTFRTCKGCGATFPLNSEYWHKNRTTFYTICKTCRRDLGRAYYHANRDEIAERLRNADEAAKEKRRARNRAWTANNIEKSRASSRNWRINNLERKLSKSREWNRANPEKMRESVKRYGQRHPERIREVLRRRRYRKAQQPCTFTAKHEALALDYFNGCCAVCGRQLKDLFATHRLHWDHWIPVSKGGSTSPSNIVPLCGGVGGCNNHKKDKMPLDWLVKSMGSKRAKVVMAEVETYFEWIESNLID